MYDIYSLSDNIIGKFVKLKNLEVNYNGELLFLDKYLDKYNNNNNLLLLNVIPIDNISTNIVDINKENEEYVEKIYELVNNYSNIKFCSTSTRILNVLKSKFIHSNCGYYLSDDLNCPDSNFYIVSDKKYYSSKISNKELFIITDENNYKELKEFIKNNFINYNNIYIIKKTP